MIVIERPNLLPLNSFWNNMCSSYFKNYGIILVTLLESVLNNYGSSRTYISIILLCFRNYKIKEAWPVFLFNLTLSQDTLLIQGYFPR